jgi:hypothetical protein
MTDLNTSNHEETSTMSKKATLLASYYVFSILILLFALKAHVNELGGSAALLLIFTGAYVIHRIFPEPNTPESYD